MSFFSFLGNKSFVGVDLGTTSLKVAEVRRDKEKLHLETYGILETYGYLERFNEALQSSSLKLSEEHAARELQALLARAGVKAKNAIASVPAFSAFSTLIEAPTMSEGETKNFIELQAKQYVPLPLSAVAFEWVKVGERTDSTGVTKQELLLISIPNEQIQKYQKLFNLAGIKLFAVEVEGMSLARSLTTGSEKTSLIIDIGSRSTSLSVAERGYLKFSSQTDFSGGSITQSIASGLGISQRRAEDLKKQRGLLGFGGTHELSTLIEPMLDVIMSEARRTIGNFESAYQGKVSNILLSGGGANLMGIEAYMGKQLGLPVEKANPFPQVSYDAILDPIVKDTGPLLGVAIGLAIKGFL